MMPSIKIAKIQEISCGTADLDLKEDSGGCFFRFSFILCMESDFL